MPRLDQVDAALDEVEEQRTSQKPLLLRGKLSRKER